MRRAVWRRLARDRKGATLVEFAIVAPVMCLFLVGGFDIAHSLYMQAALEGIVQKTGRDSSLESGTEAAQRAATDEKVRRQVHALAKTATITYTRRYYRTFSKALAALREDFTDTNGNGTCDGPVGVTPGEPYIDANNNGTWDRDGGDAGQGGAKDKTVYTVRVSYQRMLPLNKFIPSLPASQVMTANTVLQNQPYGDQASYTNTTTTRNCP